MAYQCFKKWRNVKKIILTRLRWSGKTFRVFTGDFKKKVDPYLRPIYDALVQPFWLEAKHRLMERGVIEIAFPLAYMRGRTLEDAFVILMKPE